MKLYACNIKLYTLSHYFDNFLLNFVSVCVCCARFFAVAVSVHIPASLPITSLVDIASKNAKLFCFIKIFNKLIDPDAYVLENKKIQHKNAYEQYNMTKM